jgi:SAM-dependent methyltransferase
MRKKEKELYELLEGKVLWGPFQGMNYIKTSWGSALGPKLIGSYELELHNAINEISKRGYTRILDIGCAEGYYAVGMARKCKEAEVIAYDIMSRPLSLARQLAAINRINNITFRTECNSNELASFKGEKTFVICDCEGAEEFLLNPNNCPELYQYDYLVELHAHLVPSVTELFQKWYSDTHEIKWITPKKRTSEMKHIKGLPREIRKCAVDEIRNGNEIWAFMNRVR